MNKGAALSTAVPKGASRWALRMHSLLIYVFFKIKTNLQNKLKQISFVFSLL